MLKLYENIRRLRLERGMTQADLAEAAGYNDRSMIAKIESGKVDLSRSKIETFAKVFGIPASELMGWDYEDDDDEDEDDEDKLDAPLDREIVRLFNSLDDKSRDVVLGVIKALSK